MLDRDVSKVKGLAIACDLTKPDDVRAAFDRIAATLGGRADVYLREQAQEHTAKTLDLKRTRYLHFATHGLLGGEFLPAPIDPSDPAAAQLSAVARTAKKLAAHFGFAHLDSGALYRLTALSALEAGVSLDDETALAKLAAGGNALARIHALWTIEGLFLVTPIQSAPRSAAAAAAA